MIINGVKLSGLMKVRKQGVKIVTLITCRHFLNIALSTMQGMYGSALYQMVSLNVSST